MVNGPCFEITFLRNTEFHVLVHAFSGKRHKKTHLDVEFYKNIKKDVDADSHALFTFISFDSAFIEPQIPIDNLIQKSY